MISERSREPLTGWRLWRLGEDGLLRATVWNVAWLPGERFGAACEDVPSPFWSSGASGVAHPAPDRGCECGIYAFKSRADAELLAREKVDRDVLALGRVSLWGRVIETERGYRAEYAYPYELELLGGSEAQARDVRRRYAVDVTLGLAPLALHNGGG